MSDDEREPPTTREYLRLVSLNRVSLAGIAVFVGGLATLRVVESARRLPLGAVLLLVGVALFIVGFTLAQRRLGRETRWG